MAMTQGRRFGPGQMTVELAVAFPVLLVVALIAVNAGLFLSECASFDRVVRQAVRVQATAPAYGTGADQALAAARAQVQQSFDKPYLSVELTRVSSGFDFDCYTADLRFTPTLFGLGLRSEFMGVSVPPIVHRVSYTVDTYRPGVLL